LFQGELSIHDYFSGLKHLDDLLRNVAHPVSNPAMVINDPCGLNSKFGHVISDLTTRKHCQPSSSLATICFRRRLASAT
jgi:hypothetical protein